MTALTDAPTVHAGTAYGTRGIVSRDVVARPLTDALAVVKEWAGCYEVVRRLPGGSWEPVRLRDIYGDVTRYREGDEP